MTKYHIKGLKKKKKKDNYKQALSKNMIELMKNKTPEQVNKYIDNIMLRNTKIEIIRN